MGWPLLVVTLALVLVMSIPLAVRTGLLLQWRMQGRHDAALLVEASNPTPAMLDRILGYRRQLPPSVEVWCLYDATSAPPPAALQDPLSGVRLFQFTSRSMPDHYPTMPQLLRRCPRMRTVPPHEEYRYLPYLSLGEEVVLWYNSLPRPPRHVWILEQDAGISGNVTDFIFAQEDRPEDYLPVRFGKGSVHSEELVKPKDGWIWPFCVTDQLKEFLVGRHYYMSPVHVMRFSQRYMAALTDAYERGYHSISELLYATVAVHFNLTIGAVDKKYDPLEIHPSKRFSKETYQQNENRTIVWHALKF